MKMRTMWKAFALGCAVACSLAGSAGAAGWRGTTDANNCVWARIRIDNLSSNDTTWVISNARSALASSADAAATDAQLDWDGVVPAGASSYIWVYGHISSEVTVGTADGTVTGYHAAALPESAGDGEWVITVDAAGSVTGILEPASYGVPSRSGTMPDLSVE